MPLDQHFLTSMDVVEKLVKAVNVVREDAVVDVGAGRGAITAALAERAGAVYAVESDRRLLPYLNAVAHIHPNVKVFHGNFLTLRLPHYTKVVANPPFSILEPMIQMHIDRPLPMSLLTPANFAEKLASTTPNTLLAYVVQLVYRGEVVETYPGSVLDPAYPRKGGAHPAGAQETTPHRPIHDQVSAAEGLQGQKRAPKHIVETHA
jgi:16S rRNA (adenine1518-N6/adenine1519-N6)-dimethyltransferase